MCGVPHHSAANYIARLVRKGYRVAICEQTEEAGKTKKLVRREVVRIVTPGTPIDPQLLEAREPVFLAAFVVRVKRWRCVSRYFDGRVSRDTGKRT
jgi:DNA mismatch repair protein MutS